MMLIRYKKMAGESLEGEKGRLALIFKSSKKKKKIKEGAKAMAQQI